MLPEKDMSLKTLLARGLDMETSWNVIAALLETIAHGVHWRSKMSTDSFMLALAAAASPLLELELV